MSPHSTTNSSFVSRRALQFDPPLPGNDSSERLIKPSIVATRIREFGQQSELSKGATTDGHSQHLAKVRPAAKAGSKHSVEIQAFPAKERSFSGSTRSGKLPSQKSFQSQLNSSVRGMEERSTHVPVREVVNSKVSQKIQHYMNSYDYSAGSEAKISPAHRKSLSAPEASGQTSTNEYINALKADHLEYASALPEYRIDREVIGARKDWLNPAEINANIKAVALGSPIKMQAKPSTTSLQTSSSHRNYSSTSVASAVDDEYSASIRNNNQGPRPGNPPRINNSTKSSIKDEISSMISSAVEGRSESTLGPPEPTRPDSGLLQVVSEGASFETKRRLYEYVSSLPTKPTEPVTSNYKFSSSKPVIHPKNRLSTDRSHGTDPLDGYQFSPPDSPTPLARPASASASRGLESSSAPRNPILADGNQYFVREIKSAVALPFVDDRFAVFLRERAGPAGSPGETAPLPAQLKHSLEGFKSLFRTPSDPSSGEYKFEERKCPIAPISSPSSPAHNHGQTPDGKSPCWRWWKLVRSDREVGSQYSDENSSSEDDDEAARRRSFGDSSRSSRATGSNAVNTRKGPPGFSRFGLEGTKNMERACRGKFVEQNTGNDTPEVEGHDERGTRTGEVVEKSQVLGIQANESRDHQVNTGTGESCKSGMQVVIRVEDDSTGKVWVEVTPSPKGRSRAKSIV